MKISERVLNFLRQVGMRKLDDESELSGESYTGYHYHEGDHTLNLDSETRWNYIKFYLPKVLKWNPPHENDVISPEKRAVIASKLLTYFKKHLKHVEIVDLDRRAVK